MNFEKAIAQYRKQIDAADRALLKILARRMAVSEKIGKLKKDHGAPVVQRSRWKEVIKNRVAQARRMGLDKHFMEMVLQHIHGESIRIQNRIIGGSSGKKKKSPRRCR